MERYWLVASSFLFLLSFGQTLYALGAGRFRPARVNFVLMAAAFACQTVFLYQRGQIVGGCPIKNLFEVLIFLSWSIVLLYLVIGPTFRLSLLGAFTAPLVLALQLLALLAPVDHHGTARAMPGPFVEFHAALSIAGYGAFGLAGIAGVMYLVQERLLKSRQVSALLLNLPPITALGSANTRLVLAGFLMLTVALGSGVAAGLTIDNWKAGASLLVWAAYGTLLVLERLHFFPPGRVALGSVFIFALALITLPGVSRPSLP